MTRIDPIGLSREAAQAFDRRDWDEAERLYDLLLGVVSAAGWDEQDVAAVREIRRQVDVRRRGVVMAVSS